MRLLLADDHPLSLAGLSDALAARPGVEIVARVSNGIEAIARIKTLAPDCAVLDLTMPGATGLEVVLEARRWSPGTRFAVVTGSRAANVLSELHGAGVEGLFLKSTEVDTLCDGILAVAGGACVISDPVRDLLETVEGASGLTGREIEVLQAVARGLTNQQASAALGISAKTIDTHRTNLMRKLGVRSTASLLVRAMRDGLIDVSDLD